MKISKMFLLLVTGVFYSSLVFANPTEVFCQQYISTKSNADKTKKPSSWESFGIGFRWEFNRKSFVRPYVIGDTTAIPKTNESEPFSPEILVVGQPNRISSTQKEFIDTYNAFLALKNKLVDELKVVNDQDSCVKTVSAERSNEDQPRSFDDFSNYFDQHKEIPYELENHVIASIVEKMNDKEKKYTYSVSLEQINSTLQNPSSDTVILVLHASEDGRLYDSNWNLVPNSTFRDISKKIKILAIYACHSDAVLDRYELSKVSSQENLKVVVPQVNPKLKWFLNDSAPPALFPQFLKSISKLNRANFKGEEVGANLPAEKNCSISLDLSHLEQGELGLFLNQKFIGMVSKDHESVNYVCPPAGQKSIFTMQNMNLFNEVKLEEKFEEFPATLSTSNEAISFKNSFSVEGHYTGSKAVVSEIN